MGQGQYDLASVAVKGDVHARSVTHGCYREAADVSPHEGGDLAHQLGTGELVGLAPHCRHREGQLVVLYTAGRPRTRRRELLLRRAARDSVTHTLGLR